MEQEASACIGQFGRSGFDLTPRFFISNYCEKELESFLGGSAVFSDAAQRSHIFQVELLCPAPEGHWLTAAPGRNIVKSAP